MWLYKKVEVVEENNHFYSKDGALFEGDALIYYPAADTDETYKIPNDVLEVGVYAFSRNPYLKKVYFSNDIITIKYRAFYECKNLKEVRLSNNLTDIDEYVIVYCDKWAVVIPKSVKNIGEHSFFGCERLYVYESSGALGELESGFLNADYTIINEQIDETTSIKID